MQPNEGCVLSCSPTYNLKPLSFMRLVRPLLPVWRVVVVNTAIGIAVGGCHHAPPSHLLQENPFFRTLITPQQVKRFELTVVPKPVDPFNGPAKRLNTYDEDATEGGLQRRTDAYLQYKVKTLVEATGFCKQGYILLGRFAGESQYRVRGECKDLASAEDYNQFPNTITQW